MDIFPVKFTATGPKYWLIIVTFFGVVVNFLFWFVFALSLAAGVHFGWSLVR